MAATTVQLAKTGEYLGHPQGPFVLSVADLEAMARNAEGTPVVIDYEHATQLKEPGEEVPAAGWISRVWVEGERLLGEVEWTARAEKMIDADEYRFLSPVIKPEATDRNTGENIGAVLVSVGLTNVPFMDMDPVTDDAGDEGTLNSLAPATAEAVLNSRSGSSPPDSENPPSTHNDDPDPMDESAWETFKRKIAGILNSDSDDELDVLDEARQLQSRVEELEEKLEDQEALEEERDELQSRVDELESELETVESEREAEQEDADEELLNSAVEQGKIKKSDEDEWRERLQENREATRSLLNSIEPGTVMPSGGNGPSGPSSPDDDGDDGPSVGAGGAVLDYVNEQAE